MKHMIVNTRDYLHTKDFLIANTPSDGDHATVVDTGITYQFTEAYGWCIVNVPSPVCEFIAKSIKQNGELRNEVRKLTEVNYALSLREPSKMTYKNYCHRPKDNVVCDPVNCNYSGTWEECRYGQKMNEDQGCKGNAVSEGSIVMEIEFLKHLKPETVTRSDPKAINKEIEATIEQDKQRNAMENSNCECGKKAEVCLCKECFKNAIKNEVVCHDMDLAGLGVDARIDMLRNEVDALRVAYKKMVEANELSMSNRTAFYVGTIDVLKGENEKLKESVSKLELAKKLLHNIIREMSNEQKIPKDNAEDFNTERSGEGNGQN